MEYSFGDGAGVDHSISREKHLSAPRGISLASGCEGSMCIVKKGTSMDQSQRRASIKAIRQSHGLTAQQVAETAGVRANASKSGKEGSKKSTVLRILLEFSMIHEIIPELYHI